ncbi:sensor histidine kinase [Paenibacillus apiarius]|uniref:Sensor histidine kinase n=1 Tax=Paenibacillus apiarius TaxID=46240 RepID=A0ABT4DYE9_9BACL|nr:sensor histidine kinase [Paenibacillus apiarius]MBN3525540.1 sensor histidine kinase [Paenibacillus apiarius]MCY9512611.1 sensor histidine kinase [Paenibacillus apiarius]MCY9522368.1 sensor histidine kinase [Paenibacillus apiarius]MCY9553668.1 sensor histidine kinase [Paenibacillus apiarius]MCY9556611.1 sensor histidine kinase [Paenibacillus apiarius]
MIRARTFVSLQHKIFKFTVLLVCIPILLIGSISYWRSADILQQKVSVSDLNTVTQVGLNVQFMTDYVHDTSLFLIQSDEVRRFLLSNSGSNESLEREISSMERFFLHLTNMKEFIHSIYLQGENGVTFSTHPEAVSLNGMMLEEVKRLRGKPMWFIQKHNNYDTLSFVREIRDVNNVGRRLGMVQVNIDLNYVRQLLNQQRIGTRDSFYLLNEEGLVLTSTGNASNYSQLPTSFEFSDQAHGDHGYYTVAMDKERYLITYAGIAKTGWRIAHAVPLQEMLAENAVITKMMLIAMIASLVVCVVTAILFSKRIIRPIQHLRSLMLRMERGQFQGRVQVQSNDEIAQLGRSFNRMNERLHELVNQVYEAELKKKEAELKAFQAQINPHFLYNTLDTIYWMSRMEKAYETAQLVEALSKLFRLSLNSGKELTTVNDEVNHLKNYMIIQQKRYEDMIDFHLETDNEDTLHGRTAKLILQPFVENAIVHGIEKLGEPGCIRVDVFRREDTLIYRISDTGTGVDVAEMERLMQESGANNRGFAIKNVNDRIQLYFGDDYGVTFKNNEAGGTTVEIIQPWKTGEDMT